MIPLQDFNVRVKGGIFLYSAYILKLIIMTTWDMVLDLAHIIARFLLLVCFIYAIAYIVVELDEIKELIKNKK